MTNLTVTGIAILCSLLLVANCSDSQEFITSIETATGKEAYFAQDVFSARLELSFGRQERISGTMLIETKGDRSRFNLDSGETMLFDGKDAYSSSQELLARLKKIRFEVLTWPYFAELPFKLQDPGTQLEIVKDHKMLGNFIPTARLSFDAGIGDTPDDWYLLYKDPETRLLKAAAYIVTYHQSPEKAGQDPHAILYAKYREVESVMIATEWTFHNWTRDDGAIGPAIGRAKLSRLKFIPFQASMFTATKDWIIAPR